MGFKVTIGGYPFEAEDYSVVEEATPLAAGDSQGSTGSMNITLQPNDSDVAGTMRKTGWSEVFQYGPLWFLDKDVRLKDSRKGFTLGTVSSARRSDSDGTVTLTCQTRLYDLNAYGVKAEPFVGTLRNAFIYYLSLANFDGDFFVDDSIGSRQVVFPGWTGELWFHLKEMALSQDCDISLVSGVVLLRPIRARLATKGRDIDRSFEVGGGTLAQSVEVYYYSSKAITQSLVYPPGGWKPETEVMNVNAGEESEYVLDLSASVSSIEPPIMQTFVAENYSASSVYTIIANDGLAVPVEAWQQNGGSLEVSIENDTTSLRVKLRGATNLPTSTGEAATNFSVALASDTTGNRYSTFRIVGTGVSFDKQKLSIRTTVPPEKTATEVGVTIDNIFLNTLEDAYKAGIRAAQQFSGYSPTLSGTVTAINRLGDSGAVEPLTFGQVQEVLNDKLAIPTFAEVREYTVHQLNNLTFAEDTEYWFSFVRDTAVNQVFGNVQGCRIYDKKSRRWYRIRQGTLTPPNIQQFQADDDMTFADMQTYFGERTYASVQATRTDLTFKQEQMAGLYG